MVFCGRPAETLTRHQIAAAIVAGVFFEASPKFDPPLGSTEAHAPQWDQMVITYADSHRPVVVFRRGPIAGIEEDIEEEFDGQPLDPALQRKLVESKQVFSLDVDQSSLTDEAWEMCDFIEHFIADRCDGLIYAPGEAIFDANLQPIAKVISKP